MVTGRPATCKIAPEKDVNKEIVDTPNAADENSEISIIINKDTLVMKYADDLHDRTVMAVTPVKETMDQQHEPRLSQVHNEEKDRSTLSD
jgi:hypothetical protein